VSDDRQPVYLAQRFNSAEITETNQALNISQSASSSTSSRQYFQVDLKGSKVRKDQKKIMVKVSE